MDLTSTVGAGGGPDKTILLSAEKIDKEKFHSLVVYIINENDEMFNSTIFEKAKRKKLNFFSLTERHKIDYRIIKKLLGLIKEYNIDILHSHGYKADFFGFWLSRMHKIKLVTTIHGWIENTFKEKLYNYLDKKVIRYYDRIIAVSKTMRDYLLKIGIDSSKLRLIYNGIDIEDFKKEKDYSLRKELKLGPHIPLIGMVTRLSKEKGVDIFLRIAKELLSLKKAKFVIAGDGPEKKNLEKLAQDLGIREDIIFLGQIMDIKKIYSSLDLLVSTSRTEGLPNNILEALAMEVPVVATDVGGVRELIIDNVNGLLFRPQDIEGIKKGILHLLSNRQLALNFAQAGRKIVCERFSFTERIRKIESLYLELLN